MELHSSFEEIMRDKQSLYSFFSLRLISVRVAYRTIGNVNIIDLENRGRNRICTHENDLQEVDLYRSQYKAPVQRYER
jgi:hypothetical protein